MNLRLDYRLRRPTSRVLAPAKSYRPCLPAAWSLRRKGQAGVDVKYMGLWRRVEDIDVSMHRRPATALDSSLDLWTRHVKTRSASSGGYSAQEQIRWGDANDLSQPHLKAQESLIICRGGSALTGRARSAFRTSVAPRLARASSASPSWSTCQFVASRGGGLATPREWPLSLTCSDPRCAQVSWSGRFNWTITATVPRNTCRFGAPSRPLKPAGRTLWAAQMTPTSSRRRRRSTIRRAPRNPGRFTQASGTALLSSQALRTAGAHPLGPATPASLWDRRQARSQNRRRPGDHRRNARSAAE